jgi:hypothetical protein
VPVRLPDGSWLADDLRWRFSGGRWSPIALRPRAGRPGLFWFLESPGWFPAALLSGLIALIPVAGYMNLYGWSLATADNLRAGYPLAAPANLDHVGRGVRYVAWGCLVGLVNILLTVAVGGGAAAVAFAASGQLVWTIAIGLVSSWTWGMAMSLVMRPLALPVLQLCEREGLRAALRPARIWGELRGHWDAAWYGVLALLTWTAAYYAAYFVVSFIPIIGGFAVFAVLIPANGILGLLLAAPLARYDDPPPTFERTHTNLLVGGFAALTALGVVLAWSLALVAGSVVSSHPQETACFFESGCHFQYSGSRETIARVSRDPADRTLLRVRVDFINGGGAQQTVDPTDYWISPSDEHSTQTAPSTDCPTPRATSVSAHSRESQTVCFRITDSSEYYDLHLPWTGWTTGAAAPAD